MRVEKQTCEGRFWKCGYPDEVLPGVLTIEEGGEVALELFGALGSIEDIFSPNVENFRMNGETNKLQGVTLEGCFITQQQPSMMGRTSKTIISVQCLFAGLLYEQKEEFLFDSYYFSVDCLDAWLGRTGIKVKYDTNMQGTTIRYQPPKDRTYELEGMALS